MTKLNGTLLNSAINSFQSFLIWKCPENFPVEEQANLELLIVGCIPQSLPTNFICIVHGQFKIINLNILRTKQLFPSAQNYTKYSPNILNFSMFGVNLEANLESVSKCLSGYFPVLKRESLLITFFMQLRKKMQSFFNKENKNRV